MAAPHHRGIQMVYAIPTVASLLVGSEGPHCHFRVQQVRHPSLHGQSSDAG